MDYTQKKTLYLKLQDPRHLEADSALLRKRNQKSKTPDAKYFDRQRHEQEILYELLNYATEEEILANRNLKPTSGKAKSKGSKKKAAPKKAAESKKVVVKKAPLPVAPAEEKKSPKPQVKAQPKESLK